MRKKRERERDGERDLFLSFSFPQIFDTKKNLKNKFNHQTKKKKIKENKIKQNKIKKNKNKIKKKTCPTTTTKF